MEIYIADIIIPTVLSIIVIHIINKNNNNLPKTVLYKYSILYDIAINVIHNNIKVIVIIFFELFFIIYNKIIILLFSLFYNLLS
jgi:hypothetical protein